MPTNKTLSEAVFKSINESSYPDDENVVSSELSSSALLSLSELLEQARVDVKTSISELSRLSATDIDGWIGQAKQLRSDIDESQKRSKEIVAFAAQGEELHQNAKNAASKVAFLRNETSFNDSVVDTLKAVREIKQTTDNTRQALHTNEFSQAIHLLHKAREQLEALEGCEQTRLVNVVHSRLEDLQAAIVEKLGQSWDTLVSLDTAETSLSIKEGMHRDSSNITLESIVKALSALDLLQPRLVTLRKGFDKFILQPCLQRQPNGSFASITEEEDTIRLTAGSPRKSPEAFFADINKALGFLHRCLPQTVADLVAESLIPNLIFELLSGPLTAAVPVELDGISNFRNSLAKVIEFAKFLEVEGWQGHVEVLDWVHNAPNVWFVKRSQSSLHSVRQLLKRGLGDSRAVERVETQRISKKDQVYADNANQDDWNAGWSEDETEAQPIQLNFHPSPHTNGSKVDDDDDDVSGWGFDDDEEGKGAEGGSKAQISSNATQAAEDEGEAWGWGDENEEQGDPISSPKGSRSLQNQLSSAQNTPTQTTNSSSEREITLRETYYITSLPEQILEIIIQAVEDADALAQQDSSSNPIAAAARDLYGLPSSLLSMFRASAPNFYGSNVNGNMYLYNDCLYTAEQLSAFVQHRQEKSGNFERGDRLDLNNDIPVLRLFGKRAYGREMESQRTILTDLLDGAQGFANCSEPPFAQDCDTAISSTIDRIRDLHRQWSTVLSKSALLQSIGSLLVTATSKIIVDIEDMSDISEPESQCLTSFCNRVTGLDDLFLPEQAPGADPDEKPIPLTAGYTSTWLKFQYLANILESSLIDIKYLWTEGELSLEFTADEVVDLTEALFADSDHRRRAIQEIRRGAAR